MTKDNSAFWQLVNRLREEGARFNFQGVVFKARNEGIPITLEDVRRFVSLQRNDDVLIPDDFIAHFITSYLKGMSPNSILDPIVGIGAILAPIVQGTHPQRAIGISRVSGDIEVAQAIHADVPIQWQIGNAIDLLHNDTNSFDVVVGCPPPGWKPKSEAITTTHGEVVDLHDELGRIIMAEALQKLGPNGIGIFVLTNNFLFKSSPKSMNVNLARLGFHIDAALTIPRGAFGPITSIPGLLVILKRERPEDIFVGELTAETVSGGELLKNLQMRREAEVPELGTLSKSETFLSVGSVFFWREVARQADKLGIPPMPLSAVATVNTLPITRGTEQFEDVPNSVYLPLIRNSPAVATLPELRLKPHRYAQLILDPNKASAQYVASFFNTPLGLLIRESLEYGAVTSSLDTGSLLQAPVYLPDLSIQTEVLRVQAKLTNAQTSIERLQRQLAEAPKDWLKVERQAKQWERGNEFETWMEEMPFPLASILWAYYADNSEEHKVGYLFHFFESLAMYTAVVMLSAYASDKARYLQHCHRWIGHNFRHYTQATFGSWNKLGEKLADVTRELLGHKDDRQVITQLFGQTDTELLEVITHKGLFAALSEVAQCRNDWKGHGDSAYEKQQEQRRRLGLLESQLANVRRIISDHYAQAQLLRPDNSKYTHGTYHYHAKLLMGTRTTFRTVQVETIAPMDTEELYLLGPGCKFPLRLLPFVRLMGPPDVENTACYFYNSIVEEQEQEKVRWVSYQLEGESELKRTDEQVIEALQLLNPAMLKRGGIS